MAVRNAASVDIPAIVRLLHEGYARSHYFAEGRDTIDEKEAKRLLFTAIQRHGHKTGGGCFVQVAETDGMLTGLIVGTLSRVYSIGTKLMATDLFWFASEKVEPADPMKLMRNMIDWAKSSPHCIEIRCGTTAIIRDDPEQAGVILTRLGLAPYGRIWRMEA